MSYFNCHNHTHYSNIRLLDCINRPKDLIDKAIELGLSGIAITDHEALCGHMEINQYAKKLQETNPGFTIALGNEIYLTDTRDNGQKYYHFILIAKDQLGYRAIKELSSIAWYNCYTDRGIERVPLLKSELSEIMKKYKGHVIATTACLGGELSSCLLEIEQAKKENKVGVIRQKQQQGIDFLNYCVDVFGAEDFYIECAPANNEEQIAVNKELERLSTINNLKLTVGTDSHYLTKEDRYVHKAYLNSKNGEREVDSFYEFSRLMDLDEVIDLLTLSGFSEETLDIIIQNSLEIKNKIEFFSLEKHQSIPEVKVTDYVKTPAYDNNYPILSSLFNSDNIQERYWVNECFKSLEEKKLLNNKKYIDRLEEEARVKRVIGEKL